MPPLSVADFPLVSRVVRPLRPSRPLRRISLALALALGISSSAALAGQAASLPCAPLPFLLATDANFFPIAQDQPAPLIPIELQDLGTTVSISAESQKKVKNTFALQGNVVVSYHQFKLTADEATFDRSSGEVVARGHVIFADPRFHLEADEAHYNVESEKGWFSNGHGFFHAALRARARMVVAAENPFYVNARRVDRLDDETYFIRDGRLSSCEHEKKGWSLSTRSARVHLEDKIVTRGTIFRFLDVPIFYSPVMATSISPRQRQSGFLLPHMGNSTQKGYILGEGFYWAINSSADLLLGLEDYSKRGLARSAQFRARPGAASEITVDYFGIDDRGNKAAGQRKAPGNRVRAVGQSGDMGYGFRGILDVDYISSLTFRQTWSDNFTQAVSSEVRQTAYLSKNFDAYSVNFYVSRYENFLCAGGAQAINFSNNVICPPTTGSAGVAGNSITIRQAPSVMISGMDKQVGRSPFYFAFDGSVAGVGRTEPGFATPNLSRRLDFHPELTLRVKPFWGFHFTPSWGVDATNYGASLLPDHSPINRLLTDFSADLRPPSLEKIFEHPLWGYRVKHVLEPEVRYQLVRSANKKDIDSIVRYDELDIFAETNEIEYSVANTVMIRKDSPGSAGVAPLAREFISLRFSQKYYFDPTFGGALIPGQKVVWDPTISLTGFAFAQGRRLSPVVTVLKFAPYSNYDTELRADFNPNGGGVLNAGITSHVRRGPVGMAFTDFFINRTAALLTPLPASSALSQIKSFNLLRTVATYGDVNRKGFSGAFGLDYNFAQGIAHQIVSQASYNFGCFGLDLEYRRFALGSLRRENRFRVALTLSNVGTFGNLKTRERLY